MPEKTIVVTRLNTLQVPALVAFSQVSEKEKEKKTENETSTVVQLGGYG